VLSYSIEQPGPIPDNKRSLFVMRYALELYFSNGGGPCYIISIGNFTDYTAPNFGQMKIGLEALASEDEPTLIVFPEAAYLSQSDNKGLLDLALAQAAKLKDRFVIWDVQQTTDGSKTVQQDVTSFRDNGSGSNNLNFGAAYYPYLDTIIDFNYAGKEDKVVVTLKKTKEDGTTGGADVVTNLGAPALSNLLANSIKDKLSQIPMSLPPSPAIAGIYVQTDFSRGVWKAPANSSVTYIVGPSRKINDNDNDMMNVTDTGKSVNPIRHLTGRGDMVWGARTLDGNSNEWRYISVRRFFNYVEESVKKATYRFVFEPNDANTWVSVRGMIEAFLTVQWRAGALQGVKPEQAFFVNVGLGTTMTADDIFNGRLIIEIGMAVVRPAEFIVLRFMHKVPES
jgi:hypothetical protein